MLEHDKKTDIFLAHMGVCMHTEDTLEHKEKPRYIAKIGEGVKARYFYTVEAYNAYKKALSSKDEMNELKKVTGVEDNAGYDAEATAVTRAMNKKEQGGEGSTEAANALDEYQKSKTIKGKVDAVKETYKELQSKRPAATKTDPEKTTETKTEPKSKKEIGSGIKEYAKAVSSSDEKHAEADAKAKADKANVDYQKKLDAFNEVDGTLQLKKRKEALAELEKAAAEASKANAEYSKAQQAHLDSITSNKVKAVAEVFDKRNPEVSKRIKKGRDWVKSRLG